MKNLLISVSKRTTNFFKYLIRKVQVQGLHFLKIKEFTLVKDCFQKGRNAETGLFGQALIISIVLLTITVACEKDKLEPLFATGTVLASGGLYDCPYQIILDNESHFYPINNEVLIRYKSGEQISFTYQLVDDSTCSQATSIELLEVEPFSCMPYVDLYFFNYDSLKSDPITLNDAYIENDCLVLEISYGGCTTDHPIDLSLSHPSCGTPPLPPPTFFINHDSRDEFCEMLVEKTLSYDLTPLREEGNNVDFMLHYTNSNNEIEALSFTYQY